MHLNSREIRNLNVETIFNRHCLWRCFRCCWNCLLLFGRQASLCTFDRLFVRLSRTNFSVINSRRHASLWSTHRIGWEDNRQPQQWTLALKQWNCVTGAVASWLVSSTPDRAIRVWVLSKDTLRCSWVRHLTLTVPHTTQFYKWVPANLIYVKHCLRYLGLKLWGKLSPDVRSAKTLKRLLEKRYANAILVYSQTMAARGVSSAHHNY